MTGKLIDRSLALLELLMLKPDGVGVSEAARLTDVPKGTVHRLFSDFVRLNYAVFDEERAVYRATFKMTRLALKGLAGHSLTEAVQPVLDRLAAESGELVRFSLVENDRLFYLAKARGGAGGLHIDTDMGREAKLWYSATGFAWLSSFSDTEALARARQGLADFLASGREEDVPRELNPAAFLASLNAVRSSGYSHVRDSMGPGTSAVAVPVRLPASERVTGVVSIAGPTVRLDEAAVAKQLPYLFEETQTLGSLAFAV